LWRNVGCGGSAAGVERTTERDRGGDLDPVGERVYMAKAPAAVFAPAVAGGAGCEPFASLHRRIDLPGDQLLDRLLRHRRGATKGSPDPGGRLLRCYGRLARA
jgi:hypothetical protein